MSKLTDEQIKYCEEQLNKGITPTEVGRMLHKEFNMNQEVGSIERYVRKIFNQNDSEGRKRAAALEYQEATNKVTR